MNSNMHAFQAFIDPDDSKTQPQTRRKFGSNRLTVFLSKLKLIISEISYVRYFAYVNNIKLVAMSESAR